MASSIKTHIDNKCQIQLSLASNVVQQIQVGDTIFLQIACTYNYIVLCSEFRDVHYSGLQIHSKPPDHEGGGVQVILASIPGREEKSGLVYLVCACMREIIDNNFITQIVKNGQSYKRIHMTM